MSLSMLFPPFPPSPRRTYGVRTKEKAQGGLVRLEASGSQGKVDWNPNNEAKPVLPDVQDDAGQTQEHNQPGHWSLSPGILTPNRVNTIVRMSRRCSRVVSRIPEIFASLSVLIPCLSKASAMDK
jgi:hypothetical protein